MFRTFYKIKLWNYIRNVFLNRGRPLLQDVVISKCWKKNVVLILRNNSLYSSLKWIIHSSHLHIFQLRKSFQQLFLSIILKLYPYNVFIFRNHHTHSILGVSTFFSVAVGFFFGSSCTFVVFSVASAFLIFSSRTIFLRSCRCSAASFGFLFWCTGPVRYFSGKYERYRPGPGNTRFPFGLV